MCLLMGLTYIVKAHPQHASYAEISFSDDNKHIQVALRVIPEDIENAISQLEQQTFVLKGDETTDTYLLNYLKQSFLLTNEYKQKLALSWLGKEVKYEGAWLYFTAALKDASTVYLQNNVLIRWQPAYINHVKLIHAADHSLVFTRKKLKQKIWPLP